MEKVKALLSDGGVESDACSGEIHEVSAVVAIFDNGGSLVPDIAAWIRNPATVHTFVAEVNNLSTRSRKVVKVKVFNIYGLPIIPPSSYTGVIQAFEHLEEPIRNHWSTIPLGMRKTAIAMVSEFVGGGFTVQSNPDLRSRLSLFLVAASMKFASLTTGRDIKADLSRRLSSLIDAVLQASVDDVDFQSPAPNEMVTVLLKDGSHTQIRYSCLPNYADKMMQFSGEKMPARRRSAV